MNGKASKRIRRAASITGRNVKQLKKEYKALPYHRRKMPKLNYPLPCKEGHSASLRRRLAGMQP